MPVVQYSACQKSVEEEDVAFVQERQTPVKGGPLWSVYCICDGHSGRAAAHYVRRHLWKVLSTLLPDGRLPDNPQDFEQFALAVRIAVIKALVRVGYRFKLEHPRDVSGTTVTMALLCGRLLTLANLGDSSAVVFTGAAAFLATVSHSLEANAAERKRLSDAGVVLARQEIAVGHHRQKKRGPLRCWPGGLLVSRSVGDVPTGERILSWPHVSQVILPRTGARLLMGTSGLWDVVDWQTAAYGIRGMPVADAASGAVHLAVSKGARPTKDVSALVVDVMPPDGRIFPELVFASREPREPRRKSGLGTRVMQILVCRSGCKASRREADLGRANDLRVLANTDGWVLLKMAVKTALLGSYSILTELTSGLLPEGETSRIKQSIETARPSSLGDRWSEGEASERAAAILLTTDLTADLTADLTDDGAPLSTRRASSTSLDFREFSSAPAAWRSVIIPEAAEADDSDGSERGSRTGGGHRRSHGRWSSSVGFASRAEPRGGHWGDARHRGPGHPAEGGCRSTRPDAARLPAPCPCGAGPRARRGQPAQPGFENASRAWTERPGSSRGLGPKLPSGMRSARGRSDAGASRGVPLSVDTPPRAREARCRTPSPNPSPSSEGAGHVVSFTMSPTQESVGEGSLSGFDSGKASERMGIHCSSHSMYGYMSNKVPDAAGSLGVESCPCWQLQEGRPLDAGYQRGASEQLPLSGPFADPFPRETAGHASLLDHRASMFGRGPMDQDAQLRGASLPHYARGAFNQEALPGRGPARYGVWPPESGPQLGHRAPGCGARLDGDLSAFAMGAPGQEPRLADGMSIFAPEVSAAGFSGAGAQLVPDISSAVLDSITKVTTWEDNCTEHIWGSLPAVSWSCASNPVYNQ